MVIWKYNVGVTVYEITDVRDPKHRLDTWAANIGQSDRYVVYLDSPKPINWDEWISKGGNRRCMGTSSVVGARNSVLALWDSGKKQKQQ